MNTKNRVSSRIAAAAAAYYLGKKAFGRELQDTGVQGSFGAEGDFSGQDFKFYKGGWLRSDKTKTSPLSSAMEAVLDAGGSASLAGRRQLHELDHQLLALNASPGGAADLLAACLFIDRLDGAL